ncbi:MULTISPECIES: MgtC/SapB family protein [Haloarcula]|uniref:MgtC/SapB family protein n=1 Tax=Haloarcula TaxID=2237 RepID=UPI0023EB1F9C|nr:MgtC/SapB family protein [Halomicroarcula sp. XH51]
MGLQLGAIPLDTAVLRISLAAALGMFLGLEREWSHKSAGIRTFALFSLLGVVFTIVGNETLLALGGVLVIVHGVLLAVEGLVTGEEESLALTTSVSLLVSYGIGVLVANDYILEGVVVTVFSSLLLVLKRELHGFAWGLSRTELRSATEFAILAFVVFPLLPHEPVTLPGPLSEVTLELRVIWLMVVFVAGIGIVNYAIVQSYGGRGIVVTGFFGGFASSTAVVGTMLDHVDQHPAAATYALAAILLADAAMAFRNLLIALVFTLQGRMLLAALVPLVAIVVGTVAVATYTADWSETVEMHLESPFSLRNALVFGGIFLVVVVVGGVASTRFGSAGLAVTSAVTGLVSSAGATTSAVLLYRAGEIGKQTAMVSILAATAASVLVKAALTATGPDRRLARRVALWSVAVLAVAGLSAVVLLV